MEKIICNDKVYSKYDFSLEKEFESKVVVNAAGLYSDKISKMVGIDHFEITLGASLKVVLKSGYKDYVSRRMQKNVKERIGIK